MNKEMSMGRSIRLFICLLLSFCSFLPADTVSVIIPCTCKHFDLLPEVLDALANQSLVPDEVVISLSQADKVDHDQIEALQVTNYPYSLKLVTSEKVQLAGVNRNIAAENSTGQVIITQDADDIPHPQRVEMICYFMKKTGAVHLVHQWYPSQDMADQMPHKVFVQLPQWVEHYDDFEEVKFINLLGSKNKLNLPFVTNGNIGMLREVFERCKWSNSKKMEDLKFNQDVFRSFRNSVMIFAPLLIYRNEYSSHNPNL